MKRFTETEKWRKDKWFRQLEPLAKLCWIWLYENCGREGLWEIDFYLMAFETKIPEKEVEETIWPILAEKCQVEGGFALVNSFCKQQYPNGLSARNPAHKGIIKSLKNLPFPLQGTSKVLGSTLLGTKEKEKEEEEDKDKEEEKDKEGSQNLTWDGKPIKKHKYEGYFDRKETDG